MKYLILVAILAVVLPAQAERLAVVNKGSDSVSIVDIVTGEIKDTPVGYLPHEVATDGEFVFVSNYGHQHVRSTSLSNRPGNTITMISTNNPEDRRVLQLGSGKCAPHGVVADRSKKRLYVTCEGRQEIAMVDYEKGHFLKSFRTNQPGSHMLAMDSKNRIYVTNFWTGTVSVIDTGSGELIRQIFTGRSTEGVGLSPDEQWLYVTVVEDGELVRISTKDLEVKRRVHVGAGTSPLRVEVTGDGSEILVNLTGKNTFGIFDAMTFELLAEIPVGKQPIGLAQSKGLKRAYVANMNDATISVIDVEQRQVVKTIVLEERSLPDGMALVK